MDNPQVPTGDIIMPDDNRANELKEAFNKKVIELDSLQIRGQLANLEEPLDKADIPVISFGLIAELQDTVANWPKRKEMTFEGKTYRTYSTALVNLEGDSKLLFTEVQLMYHTPEDKYPYGASLTETKPDENGSLHERHFSAKFYSESGAEIQYVEYPYRQKENGKPVINTKAIVVVARRLIQQLPRSG